MKPGTFRVGDHTRRRRCASTCVGASRGGLERPGSAPGPYRRDRRETLKAELLRDKTLEQQIYRMFSPTPVCPQSADASMQNQLKFRCRCTLSCNINIRN